MATTSFNFRAEWNTVKNNNMSAYGAYKAVYDNASEAFRKAMVSPKELYKDKESALYKDYAAHAAKKGLRTDKLTGDQYMKMSPYYAYLWAWAQIKKAALKGDTNARKAVREKKLAEQAEAVKAA